MKIQFLVGVMLTALAVSAYGQGQVILANNAGTLILNALDGQPMPPNSPVTFQLWSGPDASSLTPRLPTTGASAAGSGRIASTTIDIPSAPNGQVAFFQVRAWSSAFATYGDALNAGSWSSLSPVFSSNTSMQNQVDPPPIPVTLAGRFSGLTVFVPIPEPATWSLIGLGGMVFVVISRFRTRQAPPSTRAFH